MIVDMMKISNSINKFKDFFLLILFTDCFYYVELQGYKYFRLDTDFMDTLYN